MFAGLAWQEPDQFEFIPLGLWEIDDLINKLQKWFKVNSLFDMNKFWNNGNEKRKGGEDNYLLSYIITTNQQI